MNMPGFKSQESLYTEPSDGGLQLILEGISMSGPSPLKMIKNSFLRSYLSNV